MSAEEVFTFHAGASPLLVSVPHDGRLVPEDIAAGMTSAALALPDTDWHVAELYAFCRELDASLLVANLSRYVIDLNRPADDASLYEGQLKTGLCPTETFAGEPLYASGTGVTAAEREERVARFWRPYHDKLTARLNDLRDQHGYALLWDAHSIASRVPRLFDGELPALNIGTDGGKSCPPDVEQAVAAVARNSAYSTTVNGRFRGGYITRQYGKPATNCYAIQLELAQRSYMDEQTLVYDPSLAGTVTGTLRTMLETFMTASSARASR